MEKRVRVEFSEAEATVLFDTLNRLVDCDGLSDAAEELVAKALVDRLEGQLPLVAEADYALRLARAKEELTEEIQD